MDFELYITSEANGLLYINGKMYSQLDRFGKAITFKYNSTEKNIFSFYPIDDIVRLNIKNIPYSIILDIVENELICKSKNVKLIDYGNQVYELVFLPNYIFYTNSKSIKKNINHLDSIINIELTMNYHSNLKINFKNKNFEYNCKQFIDNYDAHIHSINGYDYLVINSSLNDFEYLMLFKIEESGIIKLAELLENKIELIDEKIYCMKKIKDMDKHIIITKYKIDDKKIIKEEKYLSKINKNTKIIKKNELIPYIFLENIKVKDYLQAKEYLSDDLKNSLTDNHLKIFFGKFIDIKQPFQEYLKSNCVALIYEEQNKYFVKYFKFLMKDNIIYNIDFVE